MPPSSLLVEPLTEREQAILRLVADGLSDREIALNLSVALDTVKWYNKRIYVKLDAQNRTQAAARAKALGLLDASVSTLPSPTLPLLPRNNLPAQVSTFIGRRREIAAVRQALDASRLLTLTGIGGSGKTRLALEVARVLLEDFSDGVFLVWLASLSNVDSMIWTIAEQLNFQFDVHRDPLAQLLSYFRPKSQLLVLDNFDHLLVGAELITAILQAAPGVKVLVTSRESLGLYGEVIYPVTGMALPDRQQDEEPVRAESVRSESEQLFIERAQSVSQDQNWHADALHHIARICRMVEGMPLGIELAATWTDTLSPQEIADEIEHSLDILEANRRDLPASQRSMRAAFDRSWNLLDAMQRTAFRRLSVFRGGFTREAGEAVSGVSLRTLHALVNKSLLRRNPQTERYEFHELLRYYAEGKLQEADEADQIYRMHAACFADFMTEQWPRLRDYRQSLTLRAAEADIENVRVAWQYWVRAGDAAQLTKFCHALWAIYDIRGWYLAGIDLFEQAIRVLRHSRSDEAQVCLGWLLTIQGLFLGAGEDIQGSSTPAPSWMVEFGVYIVTGDGRRGFQLARAGVEILRQVDTPDSMMVMPLFSLFVTSCLLDEEGIPQQTAQECLTVATRTGDSWAIAKAKQIFAIKAIGEGDYPQAEQLALESLKTFETNGDNWSLSCACIEVLALLCIRQHQFDSARHWLYIGLEAAEKIAFTSAMQAAYWQLGYAAVLEDDLAGAALYWRKAFEVAEQTLGGSTFLGFGGSKGWGNKPAS